MVKNFVLLLALFLMSMPVMAAQNYSYDFANQPFQVKSFSTPSQNASNASGNNVVENNDFPFLSYKNSAKENAKILARFNPQVRTPSLVESITGAAAGVNRDPYIITIDDKKYMMITDRSDKKWDIKNIFGYNDDKYELFASLKGLEKDGDKSKITAKELKMANIRLVLLKEDGKLDLNNKNNDFDLKNFSYIDMNNLRFALGNKTQVDTFGYFYAVVKDSNGGNRTVMGKVTYEDAEALKNYLI